jgi:digeranylgeranylglycerophospholipid reductase
MYNYDIIIIGASFSGLALASRLPKNYRVLVIDRKQRLNSVCESTGLVTTKTMELLSSFVPDLRKYLTNDISTMAVVSTDFKTNFFSSAEKPWIYSTDTPELLAAFGGTLPENVEIMLSAEFCGLRHDGDSVIVSVKKDAVSKEISCRFLVGADGGRSRVAEKSGLQKNEKFLLGYEKVFPGKIIFGANPDKTVYHYWFGEFSLGYGGWLSPSTVNGQPVFRIGLAKLAVNWGEIKKLDEFVEKLKKLGHIAPTGDRLFEYAGFIPIDGPLKNIYHDRIMLIGDAAGLCGAFAADGIKGALVSGIVAGKLIEKFFITGDETVFRGFNGELNKFDNLLKYFKKQLLYRFVWNAMKKNRTFRAMFDVIEADKASFIRQFSEAKNKGGGLMKLVLKPRILPKLIKFGLSWIRDYLL